MHDARAVANKILTIAKSKGRPLTVMQLLKLLYLAHGWKLNLYREPMINEPVQAWQYGPVVPSVYRAFGRSGSTPIAELAKHDFAPIPYDSNFSTQEIDLLNSVVDAYAHMHAFNLSDMMHKPNTPWSYTYHNSGAYSSIPNDTIMSYFDKLRRGEVDQLSA